MNFDFAAGKKDFPILARTINGHPLTYLDNAATTQKPQVVIDAIANYYSQHNANVHRGVHTLAEESTTLYEESRKTIARFFGAQAEELVLAPNTTAALNFIALGWLRLHLKPEDVVITTVIEHHSNFVPWQQLCQEVGAKLVVAPVTNDGRVDEEKLLSLAQEAGSHLRLLALNHVSNVTGAVTNIEKITNALDHHPARKNRLIVLDAAQSAGRLAVDFRKLGVDALVFSGHKLYGPMGSGGAVIRSDRLVEFSPVLYGGGMIATVQEEQTEFAIDPQDRFTAGTPDVASAVGLAAALDYLSQIPIADRTSHDQELVRLAWEALSLNPQIELIGPNPQDHQRVGSIAFQYQGVHPHDVAQILDRQGVAVRSGHHCAMPLHKHFCWPATTRASFAIYNTPEDINTLAAALNEVSAIFG